MVWGPNVGIAYPFDNLGTKDSPTSKYPTAANDPVNFAALDTNNDGLINYLDDPYLPYYPGDEYVDWVGLSLYWYPDAVTGFNQAVPPTYFVDQILGYGPTIEYFNPQTLNDGGLRNFYKRFAQDRNKPMIIPETSAPYFKDVTGPNVLPEATVKRQWWSQIYADETHTQFPLLKCVLIFEEEKADSGQSFRDWRVLYDQATRDAYLEDTAKIKDRLLYATNMKYGCDGSITIQ